VGVATTVTTPVLIAILATIGGVIVVGVGGGLIKPMQHRWEGYLAKAEEEAPRIKRQAAASPSVKEQAQQARDQFQANQTRQSPSVGSTAVGNAPRFGDPSYSSTETDGTSRY
jgi:hypothetical protein